ALQQRLAATGVVVQGGAEGGSILVDDQDWGRTPRPDKITVTPGNHVIVVRWSAGKEFRTNVYVPAGQVVNITVNDDGSAAVQQPVAVTPADAAKASDINTPPPAQHDNKKIILYATGGAVTALGVGLLVYGIVRGGANDKCGQRDKKYDLLTYCNPDDVDASKRQSIAGYVTGSVLIAGGAALLVVNALSDRGDRQLAKTQCGVGLGSGSCTFHF
ncbi:MAG: hypothetical protein JWN48_2087, partial [Myxococcaceae bacterium]|nr:hypothetical protein [Myxococcaceae bacterium]